MPSPLSDKAEATAERTGVQCVPSFLSEHCGTIRKTGASCFSTASMTECKSLIAARCFAICSSIGDRGRSETTSQFVSHFRSVFIHSLRHLKSPCRPVETRNNGRVESQPRIESQTHLGSPASYAGQLKLKPAGLGVSVVSSARCQRGQHAQSWRIRPQ